MNLEELVPPFVLCKKIPAGEFEDSCFARPDIPGEPVHTRNGKVYEHLKRCGITYYPAPTVIEILREIEPGDVGAFCGYEGDGVWHIGDCECDLYVKNGFNGKNPAELALRWWFEQKGLER